MTVAAFLSISFSEATSMTDILTLTDHAVMTSVTLATSHCHWWCYGQCCLKNKVKITVFVCNWLVYCVCFSPINHIWQPGIVLICSRRVHWLWLSSTFAFHCWSADLWMYSASMQVQSLCVTLTPITLASWMMSNNRLCSLSACMHCRSATAFLVFQHLFCIWSALSLTPLLLIVSAYNHTASSTHR